MKDQSCFCSHVSLSNGDTSEPCIVWQLCADNERTYKPRWRGSITQPSLSMPSRDSKHRMDEAAVSITEQTVNIFASGRMFQNSNKKYSRVNTQASNIVVYYPHEV